MLWEASKTKRIRVVGSGKFFSFSDWDQPLPVSNTITNNKMYDVIFFIKPKKN